MGKSDRTRFDDKRRAAVRRGLRNHSLDDCLKMIDGCAASDFHMGRDNGSSTPYNDLTLIFRDAEHMEKFIALAEYVDRSHDRIVALRRIRQQLSDAAVQGLCQDDEWREVVRHE